MASRIIPTGFTNDGSRKSKRPRVKSETHLDFIRSLPCIITGQHGVDAAHIRYGDYRYGKRHTGLQEKPDDVYAIPLQRSYHQSQHDFGDEKNWWRRWGIDPVPIAQALYIHSGNTEVCEQILAQARQQKPT